MSAHPPGIAEQPELQHIQPRISGQGQTQTSNDLRRMSALLSIVLQKSAGGRLTFQSEQ
jgi:hypothetical protein